MKNNKIKLFIDAMNMVLKQKQNNKTINHQNTVKIQYKNQESNIVVTSPYINKLEKVYQKSHEISLIDVINDFNDYITLPSQILGKRSSKIIISKSLKYCLKIVQQQDIAKICEMIQHLTKRYQDYEHNYLINIYYMFIIQHTVVGGVKLTDRYIIMPNIRCHFDQCIKTFDIKGHLQSRIINQQDQHDFKFGKDQNFIKSKQIKYIKQTLSQQILVDILTDIEENLEFLTKENIIDYSILISLEKKQNNNVKDNKYLCKYYEIGDDLIIKWAIIDYFQIYNQKKKIQNRFKSMFKKSISSVQPQMYSKRLIKFLEQNLLLHQKA